MTEFIKETVGCLKDIGFEESDVLWVGSRDGEFAMNWGDFKEKFKNLKYYAGYGSQEIAADLVVVGDNWWLERKEYDGAECWAYKRYPKITSGKSFDKIIGSWEKIVDIMEARNE